MKIYNRSFLLLLSIIVSSIAFTQSIESKNDSIVNIGVIKSNDEVIGYYASVAKGEKHELVIYDNELNEKYSAFINNSWAIKDATFNGSHYCFAISAIASRSDYYVLHSQALIFTDSMLNITGSLNTEIGNGALMDGYLPHLNPRCNPFVYPSTLSSIPFKGFALGTFNQKKGDKQTIRYFDNEGNKMYETESFYEGKSWDKIKVFESTEKYLISSLKTRNKSIGYKDERLFLNIYLQKNGDRKARIDMMAGKYDLYPLEAIYDEVKNEIVVTGSYYAKTNKVAFNMKNRIGFFLNRYTVEGELLQSNYSSWEEDIRPQISHKSNELDYLTLFHSLIPVKGGQVYGVVEQFEKSFSGIYSHDMFIVEFDKVLQIKNVELIQRPMTYTEFYVHWNGTVIKSDTKTLYFKDSELLTYSSRACSKGGDNFNIVNVFNNGKIKKRHFSGLFSLEPYEYAKYEVTKSDDYTVGVVSLINNNVEKYSIKISPEKGDFRVLPAKPGHIAVLQYFKKTKSFKMSLEKLEVQLKR